MAPPASRGHRVIQVATVQQDLQAHRELQETTERQAQQAQVSLDQQAMMVQLAHKVQLEMTEQPDQQGMMA